LKEDAVTVYGLSQLLLFLLLLFATARPVGSYMAKVFEGKSTLLSRRLLPLEHWIYRLCGANPEAEQAWVTYAWACLAFGLVNFLSLYFLVRIQGILPLNPQHFGSGQAPADAQRVTPDLAFNIAVSFMTNTSWQAYDRRAHAELSRADVGDCGAELHLHGGRNGGGDRGNQGFRSGEDPHAGQFLGGPHAVYPLYPAPVFR
jgi:K+-transporting ATPase A subunit